MSGEYEVNKWYGWQCDIDSPVHPETEVEMTNGSARYKAKAGRTNWGAVIAFRVIKPHADLIEGYMLSCEPLHATREMAEAWLAELKRKNPGMFDATKIVHMKEVRE